MNAFMFIAAMVTMQGGGAVPAMPRKTNSLGMTFVVVPGGEFTMGSTKAEADAFLARMKAANIRSWYPDSPPSESPPRRVKLTRRFALSLHETRLADFRAFVLATGYKSDAERDGKGGDGKLPTGKWADHLPQFNWREMGYPRDDEEPVLNVSWNDAVAFCAWLSKKEAVKVRLPTEAEWEYACRAGTKGPYPWGDDEAERDIYAWHGGNSGNAPHKVMTRRPNRWGIFDMTGNAYEYCSDSWMPRAAAGPLTDPRGPTQPDAKNQIVVRGGSWGTAPMHCRSAFRGSAEPNHRNRRDGFRIVWEIDD